jgi:hypothetical protein
LARPYRTWTEQPPEQAEWITDVTRLARNDFVISSAREWPPALIEVAAVGDEVLDVL